MKVPVQASLGVFVVEQVDEPVRRVGIGAAIRSHGARGEVLGQAVRQVGDRPGSQRAGLALRE
jgi:hypothetical protein